MIYEEDELTAAFAPRFRQSQTATLKSRKYLVLIIITCAFKCGADELAFFWHHPLVKICIHDSIAVRRPAFPRQTATGLV